MDSLEILQNISILNAHAIELDELVYELSEFPVERGQALLEVAKADKKIILLEKSLQN
ncbi:hypothetical protein UFOVP219_24 [uncultured Caudovirales phage]|uniref:Uncharacterized protein n=1 Tax=uncultured Caudovirales phage TaxID=2100421 RepID=A0A6J7WKY8_9CAUD|nr:hypothetical protein UFOVP219_24 [uncultured Caudovirales phage]